MLSVILNLFQDPYISFKAWMLKPVQHDKSRGRYVAVSLLLLASVCMLQGKVHAQGVNDFIINDFSADYYLTRDDPQGEMHVTEKINLTFSGQNHGILRAIPQTYKDHSLKLHVDNVSSETGAPSQFTTYSDSGNTVLKIGDPSRTITGNQSYTIQYTMQNVITFYNDHDELYWDINGDQWQQPFSHVSATFHLPPGVKADQAKCFAGGYGSSAETCLVANENGKVRAETMGTLLGNETLTVLMSLPKGSFMPPTWKDWLRDNYHKLLAIFLPPLVIGGWAYKRWRKNGKDLPGRGTIIAEYEPPNGLGPAEVAVVHNYRLNTPNVSAVIIDLAIRKYIKIIETTKKSILKDKKEYTFQLLNTQWQDLKPHEAEVLSGIFLTKTIDTEVELSSLKGSFYKTIQKIQTSLPKELTAAGYFPSNPTSAGGSMYVLGFVLFGGSFVLHSWWTLGFIIASVIVFVFAALMPKRTAAGVEAYEKIEGLKLYINTAEKDRIKMLQSPDSPYAGKTDLPKQTVELFEKLLPYAMVLGVEKQWAEQFKDIYKTPPDWYSGNWTTFNTIYLANSLNSTVSAMGTNFSPPSSSGSSGFSGGGFSGGGGGGGGGGGW